MLMFTRETLILQGSTQGTLLLERFPTLNFSLELLRHYGQYCFHCRQGSYQCQSHHWNKCRQELTKGRCSCTICWIIAAMKGVYLTITLLQGDHSEYISPATARGLLGLLISVNKDFISNYLYNHPHFAFKPLFFSFARLAEPMPVLRFMHLLLILEQPYFLFRVSPYLLFRLTQPFSFSYC